MKSKLQLAAINIIFKITILLANTAVAFGLSWVLFMGLGVEEAASAASMFAYVWLFFVVILSHTIDSIQDVRKEK